MVLTDREIQAAIENRQILIDPAPSEIAYSSTSLDLTLAKFIRDWKKPAAKGVEQVVSPATEGYVFSEFAREYSESRELGKDGFIVESGVFVLGWAAENIELPA